MGIHKIGGKHPSANFVKKLSKFPIPHYNPPAHSSFSLLFLVKISHSLHYSHFFFGGGRRGRNMVLSKKVNKPLRKGDCLPLFHLHLLFFITESIQSKFKVYIFQSLT